MKIFLYIFITLVMFFQTGIHSTVSLNNHWIIRLIGPFYRDKEGNTMITGLKRKSCYRPNKRIQIWRKLVRPDYSFFLWRAREIPQHWAISGLASVHFKQCISNTTPSVLETLLNENNGDNFPCWETPRNQIEYIYRKGGI